MKDISLTGVDRLFLFGQNDQHLAQIEKKYGVSLVARGDKLILNGPDAAVGEADGLLSHLVERIRRGPSIEEAELSELILQSPAPPQYDQIIDGKHVANTHKTIIRARTAGQAEYLKAIDTNDIVFGIGPAGTGKTYLAVAMAVAALRQKQVSRIILARPAVEAGEKLGFLPGSFEDKVDPYLRPLYDALQELLEPERMLRLQSMKVVEVAPLAFMRGRTLNESFVILDEAQNTTPAQMKMFLTRLGAGSKAVITGDITQIDLPKGQPSGLIEVRNILRDVDGLDFIHLSERDVVRNPLVQRIVQAYEQQDGPGVDPSRPASSTSTPSSADSQEP